MDNIKEKTIEGNVGLVEEKQTRIVLQDDELEEKTVPARTNKGRQVRKLDPSLVEKARSIYIATDKSMDSIALELGINRHTLYKYSREEKWALLKQNPEFQSWSRELVDELYTSINFFTDSKNILHSLLLREENQNPKDVKLLIEAFKIADERTTNLRLLRENMNKDTDTYEE